jgi:hypothetical protein
MGSFGLGLAIGAQFEQAAHFLLHGISRQANPRLSVAECNNSGFPRNLSKMLTVDWAMAFTMYSWLQGMRFDGFGK